MPLILPGNVGSATAGGYNVANSVRLFSNTFLHKTPTGDSNKQVFTFSTWLKRGNITAEMGIFTAGNDSNSNGFFTVMFTDADELNIQFYDGAFDDLKTNRKFRDVSAWYHIVVAVDTTDGTAANRIKVYVNGVQESSFASSDYPDENQNFDINEDANDVYVGVRRNSGGSPAGYYDGYIAEAVLIDGSQLAADQFGEFDSDSGIWKPIDVSGLTFGTNGFYLDFQASGNLGNDANGGTDLTENNLTAIDQSTDTCTNNAVTFMSNHPSADAFVLSEGNLQINRSGTGIVGLYGSSIMLSKGKWYWEVKYTAVSGSNRTRTGVAAYESITGTSTIENDYSGFEFSSRAEGRVAITEAGSTTEIDGFADFEVNDIVSYALDMDNTKLYVGINGVFFNYDTANTGGDPTSGSGYITNSAVALAAPVTIYAGNSRPATGSDMELQFNFGATNTFAISSGNTDGNGYGNFEYAVPSGYYAINSKNLAEYG